MTRAQSSCLRSLAEESEGGEETYYTALYEADPSDVITGSDADVTVAYAPARGLKGFLRRTFPGARVECNLMDMLKRCRNDGEGYRMYVEVREGEADFVFLNGRDRSPHLPTDGLPEMILCIMHST